MTKIDRQSHNNDLLAIKFETAYDLLIKEKEASFSGDQAEQASYQKKTPGDISNV